jgi:hypothetical protein
MRSARSSIAITGAPMAHVILPVSGATISLRQPTGAEDIVLAEHHSDDPALALGLVDRLATADTPIEWADLSVTDVDTIIVRLRQALVGDRVIAEGSCSVPSCRQAVDLSFGLDAYLAHQRPRHKPATVTSQTPGWFDLPVPGADPVQFRLPTLADQVAVWAMPNPAAALAARCIRPPMPSRRTGDGPPSTAALRPDPGTLSRLRRAHRRSVRGTRLLPARITRTSAVHLRRYRCVGRAVSLVGASHPDAALRPPRPICRACSPGARSLSGRTKHEAPFLPRADRPVATRRRHAGFGTATAAVPARSAGPSCIRRNLGYYPPAQRTLIAATCRRPPWRRRHRTADHHRSTGSFHRRHTRPPPPNGPGPAGAAGDARGPSCGGVIPFGDRDSATAPNRVHRTSQPIHPSGLYTHRRSAGHPAHNRRP